ncbi:cytochrome P450 [Streptomyces nigrescens]|uniref:Cytochrome P450 n=2 Tax=Streptomyces nigrescens TaxID=1920 RepID=A0A640TB11_STRNI|nr:cytochrome P450 [Streptomyces libani subsp. libani]GGV86711.1 cytochrome P450 [Streptomyces libani subsp. libani]
MESATVAPPMVPSVDRRSVIRLFSRLRTPDGQANPLPYYTELRRMGDIVPAPWGGHLVTSFGLCDHVLRNRSWLVPDSGWRARQGEATRWMASSSQEMASTLPGLNPPHHTRARRSMGSMFNRNSMEDIKNSVERNTEELLDRLAERLKDGEADFSSLVSEELPVLTIGEWLGLPTADYELLRSLTHDQVFAQELLPSASQLAKSDAATRNLREYFIALVRERRRAPGDDPISAWIRTWDELEPHQDAADEAVYRLALFVVLAALETTSNLLSTMVWLIAEHPRQRGWLRAYPEYIPGAVEEVLRYDSPTHVVSRIAGEDTTLAGVPVEKDQMVHLMVGAANHDPAHHADPGLFDVRRKATHLSFSGGIHYCLGAALARLEATTLLTGVLRRFPALRCGTPDWAPRVAFRRLMTLPVVES